MTEARAQLREEFLKNKNVSSPEELKALYQGVEEVDEMLRFNIVQGKLNSNGNYEVCYFYDHFMPHCLFILLLFLGLTE